MAKKRSGWGKVRRNSEQPASGKVPGTTRVGLGFSAAWVAYGIVTLLCVAWVLAHTFFFDAVAVRLTDTADRGISEERRLPVFLHTIAFDGYVWNRHAEHLGRDGSYRLRHTDFDNAPDGREVHWNTAFAAFLRGLGAWRQAVTGEPLRNSIFRMSIWANPILHVLAICFFSGLAARRFGPLSGAVIALSMAGVEMFVEGFLPGYPDHHGLISLSVFGLVFGLAWAGVGWIQKPGGTDWVLPRSLRQARRGMILSAVSGAAGLWISALSAAMILCSIGVAILGFVFFFSRFPGRKPECEYYPGLWKTWTAWGVGGSLFFYLLEYFPGHMGFRLEVNHPLYALSWLGGGWAIQELTRWMRDAGRTKTPFPWGTLLLPGLLCAALPLVILAGGSSVHSVLDPFMMRLHTHISEFMPLIPMIVHKRMSWRVAVGWFPLLLLAVALFQFPKSIGRGTKVVLLFLAIPILVTFSLQLHQSRWGLLTAPLYLALGGLVIPLAWRLVPRRAALRLPAAALLLLFAYQNFVPALRDVRKVWAQYRAGDKIVATSGQALSLLHRRMVYAIRHSAGDRPVVLLSSPNSSCLLSSLGGFRTLGTLYWENAAGLKAAASCFHAQNDDEAFARLQEHGVTHMAFMTWEHFIEPYYHLLYPDPASGVSLQHSFAKKVFFDKVIPVWCRPIIFPPDELTQALHQEVLLLQIVPDQTLEEAWLHLARYALQVKKKPDAAEALYRRILDSIPGANPVRIELINFLFNQGRPADAAAEVLNILPRLSREVRIRLAEQSANRLREEGEPEWADRILGVLEAAPEHGPGAAP